MNKALVERFKIEGLTLQIEAAKFLQAFLKTQRHQQRALDDVIANIPKNSLPSNILGVEPLKKAIESISQNDEELIRTEVLRFISAFEVPRLSYNSHRKGFTHVSVPLKGSLHSDSEAKNNALKQRLMTIRQRLARQDTFSEPLLKSLAAKRDYFQLTPIDSLLGSTGVKTVLGLLSQIQEGRWYLEDDKGFVQIDISLVRITAGLFTEGCVVIAQGELQNDTFVVSEMAMPPAEPRVDTLSAFPNLDFLGTPPPQKLLEKLEKYEASSEMFVVLSDVWLDQPAVMEHLRILFSGYEQYCPKLFIFIGNFASRPFGQKYEDSQAYKTQIDSLCDLLCSFRSLVQQSTFVFVPGPADPGGGQILPRPPLPDYFTRSLRERLHNVAFASNPCRIRYCTQDIVVFREDLLSKMRRHCVVKPQEQPALSQQLVKTVIDQAHLSPLPLSVRPVYWSFDHALGIYPIPHLLIQADSAQQFATEYCGCKCFNPGTFAADSAFIVYNPAQKDVEFSRIAGAALDEAPDGDEDEVPGDEEEVAPRAGTKHRAAEEPAADDVDDIKASKNELSLLRSSALPLGPKS